MLGVLVWKVIQGHIQKSPSPLQEQAHGFDRMNTNPLFQIHLPAIAIKEIVIIIYAVR